MSKKFIFLIIFLAFLLRFFLFIQKRDFWHDEAALLMNLREKSFSELLKVKLEYNQIAPPLFLVLCKFFYLLDKEKNNEILLRFVPFLCSVISIFLFYNFLSKINFDSNYCFFSMLSFCLSEMLILYSSELKHYSMDLLFSILFLIFFLKFLKKWTLFYFLLFLFSGILFPFFSFVIFLLFPPTLVISFFYFLRKKSKVLYVILLFFVWLIFATFYYYNFLSHHRGNEFFYTYWKNFFFDPFKFSEYIRFIGVFISLFHGACGLRAPIIAFFLFLTGLIFIFKKSKLLFFLIFLSTLTCAIFSFISFYPFHGRLLLFIVPLFLLSINASFLTQNVKFKSLIYVVYFFVIVRTFYYDIKLLIFPHRIEIKRAISYLKKESVKEVYVSESLKLPFKIYEKSFLFLDKENLKDQEKLLLLLDKDEFTEFKKNKNFSILDSLKFFNVYLCRLKVL